MAQQVVFEADGTDVPIGSYEVGETYGTLPTPSRDGYAFEGWFSDAQLTQRVYPSSTVSASVTVLYAKWTDLASRVTVSFDSNGGGAVSPRDYTADEAYGSLPTPGRTGYAFEGWFSDQALSVRVYDSSIVSSSVGTLYAKWRANTYILRLHRNAGPNDTATAGRSQTYDQARALPKIATELKWTRNGYDFLGWAVTADATSARFADGAAVKNFSAIQGDTVHLYAVWKSVPVPTQTYILRLHRNNSERDGATAGRTYTIGKARALPKIQTELKWAPRTGYDFLGWARSATATTAQYTDGQSLKDLTTTANAEVHVYAVWKAHKYIVRLHRNNSKNDGATTGRAFDYDQVRFLPTMNELKWTRSGYMFLGWSQAQSSTTVKYADGLNVYNLSPNDGEELHIWGVWKKASAGAYLLRLHRNNSERDGATAGRQLVLNTYRKLPTAKELGWTRSGYAFAGWATTAKNAAAGKVAYTDGQNVRNLSTTTGATVHLYAVWTIPGFTVVDGVLTKVELNGATTVTIPSNVKVIGDNAFRDCNGLVRVTIPDGVTGIGTSAFFGCRNLARVTIPNSVTHIDDYAFFCCSGLTDMVIPNSVMRIGEYALYSCSGLTGVTIGTGVTHIGEYAFGFCSELVRMTIPGSVASIGDYAFSGCSTLTSITFEGSAPASSNLLFYSVDLGCVIRVSRRSTGWGVAIPGTWNGLRIEYSD